MTQEYKPTKKEVLKQIVVPSKENRNKIKNYLKNSLTQNLEYYILPTSSRDNQNNNALGYMGFGAQLATYIGLAQHDIPAYWIPVATNVLSGLYEAGRYVYKRAEKKLIEKNLENKLTEDKQ